MLWGGRREVTWVARRAACARRLIRRPTPSPWGRGAWGEGRQDGGGEVSRAGRRCCHRHRRLAPVASGSSSSSHLRESVPVSDPAGKVSPPLIPFLPPLLLPDSLPLPHPLQGAVQGRAEGGGPPPHPGLGPPLAAPPLRARGLRGHGPGGGPAALVSSARQRRALRSPRVELSGPEGPAVRVGDTSFKRGVSVCGRRLRPCLGRPLWFLQLDQGL